MRIPRHDDPLNPAKGILLAIALSIPFWGAVGYGFKTGYDKLVQVHLPDQEAFHAAPRTASLEAGR